MVCVTRTHTDGVVTLTLFEPEDASVMTAADSDPEIRKRFDFPDDFVPAIEHSLAVVHRWRAERAAGTRFTYAVRDATTNELLGGCELKPLRAGEANVSYWTYPQHRNKGYAKRAVRLLLAVGHGFDVFVAQIAPDNVASHRVARACGLRVVEHLTPNTQHL